MEDQAREHRSRGLFWISILLAGTAFAVATLVALVRRWRTEQVTQSLSRLQTPAPQAVLDLQGLTEDEAAARHLEGQDNALRFKSPYSTREIWRANTLSIFNLSMVGLAIVQILLGKWLDALLTTAVMLLGIGLNVGQQLWARGRLQKLEQTTRSEATVVREGRVRSIDPSEVVRGDVLVVGPGDQVLADGQVRGEGQIVVDESMLTGDPGRHARQAGDLIYAGSFCVAGHGAYEAQKVGSDRLIAALTGEFEAVEERLTPLERTMDRLLRALLVVVCVMSVLLLADYFDLVLPFVHSDAFSSAASVIFGIAPASLFLMILVNYAMGTADLARIGALVHRTRSVESLAQATVVCFAKAGILTGVGVEMEAVDPPRSAGNALRLAESRIRQILGDYARSTSLGFPGVAAMAAAFPGNRRVVHEEAPFLSLYGWSAVSFDDADLRGVYVLGAPEVLEAYLIADDAGAEEAPEEEPPPGGLRERLASLRGSFMRTGERPPAPPKPIQDPTGPGQGPIQGLADRISQALGRNDEKAPRDEESVTHVEDPGYLLAYHPELTQLHASDGTPRLPQGLIPLCRLRFTDQVRQEVAETVRAFFQAGLGLKVLSPDEPQRIAAVLEQAGLDGSHDRSVHSITGPELSALGHSQQTRAVVKGTIFGQVTPEQEGQVVKILRQQDEAVAVVGDGVNDLAAMRQADLSITRQSSSPAALSVADIVLLGDSPRALLRALDKGQRIANGLFDILKLYLVQISYLVLLILAIWGTGLGFPYLSKQGSLITFASIILPSVGLSLWAPAGVLPRARLGRLLALFVVPVAVMMSAAGVIVYRFFLDRTANVAYAQLALTYMLVVSGLTVVVLLRPPFRYRVGGDERGGDWRPAALAFVLLILVLVVASIPLADDLFGLKPLQQPTDYLVVGMAVLAWAFAASLTWRVVMLDRPRQQVFR